MADQTAIEWTDATWNAIRGCSRVSEGCRHCYAEGMAARFSDPGQWGHGLATRNPARWTGKVTLDEAALLKPLRWRKPRRIFVTSIGDPFHADVPDEWLDRLFAVMALAHQHTFQFLTKRPERLREYVASASARVRNLLRDTAQFMTSAELAETWPADARTVQREAYRTYARFEVEGAWTWPLRNVWLGTSISNQGDADRFIPDLLATPAAVRFVSYEPALGPVDLGRFMWPVHPRWPARYSSPKEALAAGAEVTYHRQALVAASATFLDWVIVGGESGPRARPMHPDWARSLRDQCAAAGVPFLFKQWGEWHPDALLYTEAKPGGQCPPPRMRIGKKKSGRLLDGVLHDGYPGAAR